MRPEQIVPVPVRLRFQHGPESLGSEGLSGTVKGDGDAAAVGVAVEPVRTGPTIERETIPKEGRNNLPGGQAA